MLLYEQESDFAKGHLNGDEEPVICLRFDFLSLIFIDPTRMDAILWNKILAYDFDHPMSEYGFSTRLARENYWTKNFTAKAIVEYKKFMYLAAVSDSMVSPSEVIDVVWHEHLIFTKSYKEFCDLLGKQIQHVPSTHNRSEFEKFRKAKQRTKELYQSTFLLTSSPFNVPSITRYSFFVFR